MAHGEVSVKPVGFVRSPFTEVSGDARRTIAEVVLNEEYTPALEGIEEYSHVIILFWMHKMTDSERKILKIHPRGHEDIPMVGVFATRSKLRPNPIGLAVVELLDKRGNILKVKGLDAFDGTPVLDVKPYDLYDVKQDIRVPQWWSRLTGQSQK